MGVENGELEHGWVLLRDDVAGGGGAELGHAFGAADLEDEVGLGGRVDEVEVAPLLEGGVELVVGGVGAAGDLAVEVVVAAGVGEEDVFGSGDAGDGVLVRWLLRRGGRWCFARVGEGKRAEQQARRRKSAGEVVCSDLCSSETPPKEERCGRF